MATTLGAASAVWYVAYGSNLRSERLACYLEGGRPPGARRTYTGCRDRTAPRAHAALALPGTLGFGGSSGVWGGGAAFYDPHSPGQTAARAYLLTPGQLSDVVAQETRRPVGEDLELHPPRAHRTVPSAGLYDTVLHLGERDSLPAYTLTAAQPPETAAPAPAYLRTIVAGLAEAWGWGPETCATYLLRARGVGPTWSRRSLINVAGGS